MYANQDTLRYQRKMTRAKCLKANFVLDNMKGIYPCTSHDKSVNQNWTLSLNMQLLVLSILSSFLHPLGHSFCLPQTKEIVLSKLVASYIVAVFSPSIKLLSSDACCHSQDFGSMQENDYCCCLFMVLYLRWMLEKILGACYLSFFLFFRFSFLLTYVGVHGFISVLRSGFLILQYLNTALYLCHLKLTSVLAGQFPLYMQHFETNFLPTSRSLQVLYRLWNWFFAHFTASSAALVLNILSIKI